MAVVRLLPGQVEMHLPTYLVMHEDLKLAPRCRAAFDVLAEGLIAYRAGIKGTHAPSAEKRSRPD